jgi:hypothetical protein
MDPTNDTTNFDAQIAAEMAALEELEKKRHSETKRRNQAAQLEALRRQRALAEALPGLEGEWGDEGKGIKTIGTNEGPVVVRKPSRPKCRQFMNETKSLQKLDVDICSAFVKPLIVYPAATDADRILESIPLVAVTLAIQAFELGTGKANIEGK